MRICNCKTPCDYFIQSKEDVCPFIGKPVSEYSKCSGCVDSIDEKDMKKMDIVECPYQDICATIRFWKDEKADYIREVCKKEEYKHCLHFIGLNANPSLVKEARERMKNKEKRVFCEHVGDYIIVDEMNHGRGCVPRCPNKDSSSCPLHILKKSGGDKLDE